MPRARSAVPRNRRRQRLLRQTRGHLAGRHALLRQARESRFKALSHAYRHRRERKRSFRRLWITRINAAAREHGISYSQTITLLKGAQIALDRKSLAELAVREPEAFAQVLQRARAALSS